jgi:uridine phosphorylase
MKKDNAMMHRDVHLSAQDVLTSLGCDVSEFAPVALVSGQPQRSMQCLEHLENPVKNFNFLGYTFWTGGYQGRRLTVGNGGLYSPDTAIITELLCSAGVDILIRIGSCGALREDIGIGDYILTTEVLRGDGATRYYVDDNYKNTLNDDINAMIQESVAKRGKVHQGGVWSTDALLRERKDIVNPYIERGAIAVDMVTSSFVTVANVYNKKVAVIMVVSDNLITGRLGFMSDVLYRAEKNLVDSIFEVVKKLDE